LTSPPVARQNTKMEDDLTTPSYFSLNFASDDPRAVGSF
jgi:hypothetical protein